MSTDTLSRGRKALVVGLVLAVVTLVIVTGLLLRAYGPGNMGLGFLQGAAIGLLAAGLAIWRALRRPESATTFERAWTQTGDERDDVVLTQALAVVGLLALPLTGVAAIAIGLGAPVEMMLALLLLTELLVGAVAFAVINRRG